MEKKYLLIGIAALSFGSGILYEKWKVERRPYFVSERNGEYFLVDRRNNREYKTTHIEKMYKIVSELFSVMNDEKKEKLELIVEGGEDGRK